MKMLAFLFWCDDSPPPTKTVAKLSRIHSADVQSLSQTRGLRTDEKKPALGGLPAASARRLRQIRHQTDNFFARPSGRRLSYSSNGWWIHGLVASIST